MSSPGFGCSQAVKAQGWDSNAQSFQPPVSARSWSPDLRPQLPFSDVLGPSVSVRLLSCFSCPLAFSSGPWLGPAPAACRPGTSRALAAPWPLACPLLARCDVGFLTTSQFLKISHFLTISQLPTISQFLTILKVLEISQFFTISQPLTISRENLT